MQLPPVRGSPVFHQPKSFEPAVQLWRTLSFCELTQNMRQRGDTTFVDPLNDLRISELKTQHLSILLEKVDKNLSGEFAIGKALRIDPTNALVDFHNDQALQHHQQLGHKLLNLKQLTESLTLSKILAKLPLKGVFQKISTRLAACQAHCDDI